MIRTNITQFRISAHNLKIETGRHRRPAKIPLEDGKCETCGMLQDVLHILMECEKLQNCWNIL